MPASAEEPPVYTGDYGRAMNHSALCRRRIAP